MALDFNDLLYGIGSEVRRIRKEKNISIEKLSFSSGLSKNYISDFENGRRNATLKVLVKICTALEMELLDLFVNIYFEDYEI